jgi:hypothetical protein
LIVAALHAGAVLTISVVTAALVALLLARSLATRRALRSRVAFELRSADAFDPAGFPPRDDLGAE